MKRARTDTAVLSGTVYHILADTTDDADPIWEAYQRAAIDTSAPLFQRRALQSVSPSSFLFFSLYRLEVSTFRGGNWCH